MIQNVLTVNYQRFLWKNLHSYQTGKATNGSYVHLITVTIREIELCLQLVNNMMEQN